ncbi:MAG: response regulator [Thiobacillus sp.]|nr:response regulator [Thiobacillus sp.]
MHYGTDSSRNKSSLSTKNYTAANFPRGTRHDASMLKVFLIEDSALLQELLAGMLAELDGVEYCGCADGESEALNQMAQNPVDLVIIDIELKQGSGIGVLDALQTDSPRYGRPRKAVLTNYAHATMRKRCERIGMDAFFDKSLQINQLIDYVVDAAREKRAS